LLFVSAFAFSADDRSSSDLILPSSGIQQERIALPNSGARQRNASPVRILKLVAAQPPTQSVSIAPQSDAAAPLIAPAPHAASASIALPPDVAPPSIAAQPEVAAPSIQKEVVPTEFKPVFPAVRDAAPLSRTEFSPKPPTGFSAQPRAGETGGSLNPLPPKREALGGDNLRQLLLQRARPLARDVAMTKRSPTSPGKASEVRRVSHQQDALKSDSPIPTAPESRRPPPRPSDYPASEQSAVDQRLVILGAARNAVRAGRADEAVGRFEEYLAAAPNDLEVREEYAGVLGQMKQFARATAELESILKRQPERAPRLRTEIGNMHVQAKAFDNAVEQFSMALAALPNMQNAGVKLQRLDIATQLARAMGFAGDVDGSALTFARNLSEVSPGDPDAPRLLGALLLDLDRPEEAVAHLKVQRTRYKSDFEVFAYFIRSLAATDQTNLASQAIDEMSQAGRGAADGLLFVGAMLAQSGETTLAERAFLRALELLPNSLAGRLGLASVMLAEYRLDAARQMLQSIVPDDDHRRDYLLLGSVLFVRCGEFADAKSIYQTILDANPDDVDARLGLAGVYEFARDHERAKAEYLKVDPLGRHAWKGRIGAMRILAEQRRFSEAIDAAEWLLRDRRINVETLTAVMECLGKSGAAERAVEIGREFIARATRHGDAASVDISIGRALLRLGRTTEAVTAFDAALAHRAGRIPPAFFGRAKAMARGPLCDLAGLFAAVAVGKGGRVANELALVDLFVEDRDDIHAEQVCRMILDVDPTNLAAWTRLCECLHRQAIQSGDIRETLAACRRTLELSPTNIRVLLTVARSKVIVKCYHDAAADYDRVIEIDPDFSVPFREKARALYTANDFDDGHAANSEILTPGAKVRLEASLRRLIPCSMDWRTTLEAFLDARSPGPTLAKKLREFIESNALPVGLDLEIRRMLLDFEAFSRLEAAVTWEDRGKQAKGLRDREAIDAYSRAIEIEPDNAEASMDLAQALGTIRRTNAEIMQYSETLAIDPRHRDAAIASDRAFHEINPQLHTVFNLEREKGASRLAAITRSRVGEFLQWPLGDEGERCLLGFSRVGYHPDGDRRLDGNILTFDLQKRICPDYWMFGTINYEHYADRLHSMPTYRFGAESICDQWRFRGEAMSEFVVQNAETLRQNIWRQGTRWSARWQMNRRWDFLGAYSFWRYNDGNDLNEMKLRADYLFCFLPTELKGVISIDGQTFREPTIITSSDGVDVTGAVHPYFTPRGFVIYEGRLEWTHYFTRDHFLHSNNSWYSLQYGIAWDSEFVNYNLFRVLFNHDCGSWMSVGFDAHATIADIYKGAWFGAYLTLRRPLPDSGRPCGPSCLSMP
jgi:tetratricopeptide (TPR) repeat protein